ncbi:rhomboid family intramembrane serine protease [Bailinhaonella thermotolerans]|uniref:Rhomboid family intramembrane serine protease n=1 Tax=Bailinhaonella thermotolerans TaxID=1070861 RepID=A0A3A4AW99_9ACTN|nr:rhomboid family intramembrane serine protease [Bailinhaonella thermotolerans]RJL30133.1 rhomboid family intramembrane serine protease [Bailinhaonella thermotolerans]
MSETGEVTTCHRHPKRETYVRCVRCDRHVCADCRRDAAVGFQCLDCVREGNRTLRPARTVFGGTARAAPVLTYALIGLNIAAYVAELAVPGFLGRFELIGLELMDGAGSRWQYDGGHTFGMDVVGVAAGEWYRLLTAAFLHLLPTSGHFGILHIVVNMFWLWSLGRVVEEQLGRARFLALYLLSALGGSVLHYLIAPQSPAVGASGAVFGLAAAYFVIGRRLGRDPGGATRLLVFFVLWMVISAGFSSWQGHLGGLLAGGALTLAFAHAPAARRTAVQAAAGGGLFVLLAALAVYRTGTLLAGI